MSTAEPRLTLLDRVFYVSLILKGLDGVLELVGGVLLLVVTPTQIGAIAKFLTFHELSEDPRDFIANSLLDLVAGLNVSVALFGAFYLLLHGVVKVVLVWAVLRDHLWAYPWLIAFLLLFIVYQGYELVVAFSWALLLLTVFDIFIAYVTFREYGIHRARRRREVSAK